MQARQNPKKRDRILMSRVTQILEGIDTIPVGVLGRGGAPQKKIQTQAIATATVTNAIQQYSQPRKHRLRLKLLLLFLPQILFSTSQTLQYQSEDTILKLPGAHYNHRVYLLNGKNNEFASNLFETRHFASATEPQKTRQNKNISGCVDPRRD